METHKRELREYQRSDGSVPFLTWLHSLRDAKSRAIVRLRLDRLEHGNRGDWKSVGQGVLELRISYGPGFRIYFGEDGTYVVILLCGGDKSSQRHDIARAHNYWTDYWRRKNAT